MRTRCFTLSLCSWSCQWDVPCGTAEGDTPSLGQRASDSPLSAFRDACEVRLGAAKSLWVRGMLRERPRGGNRRKPVGDSSLGFPLLAHRSGLSPSCRREFWVPRALIG